MFIMFTVLLATSIILLTIPLFTSFKALFNREVMSPFECGFDPYHSSRIPFSLQFFLIAVIFLIFDIEITLLLPLPLALTSNYPIFYLCSSTIFILILLLGTYYEWYKGALDWAF